MPGMEATVGWLVGWLVGSLRDVQMVTTNQHPNKNTGEKRRRCGGRPPEMWMEGKIRETRIARVTLLNKRLIVWPVPY